MERRNEKLISVFARVLRERRKAVGISQEELAYRAGISMSYMSLLETRQRQPTITVIDSLCRELGLTISEFFRQVETQDGIGHATAADQ